MYSSTRCGCEWAPLRGATAIEISHPRELSPSYYGGKKESGAPLYVGWVENLPEAFRLGDRTLIGETAAEHWGSNGRDATSDGISDSGREHWWM